MLTNWERIEEIFHAVLGVAPGERDQLAVQLCAGDIELQAEVESLIRLEDQSHDLLDKAPGELAAELLALERPLLEPGQEVGRYRVVSLLGQGGMGEVYLGEDAMLGRQAALKLLPRRFTASADRLRRFAREARAAAALNHPNVVTIYELGQFGDGFFIAMEYVEGQTLRAVISEGASATTALGLLAQAAGALAAAHKAGVVHRDIKPDNIMVRADGVVKILDFGLATEGTEEDEATDSASGTFSYMSPQHMTGQAPTAASDVFSLGIIACELLGHGHPFPGRTTAEVVDAIRNGAPVSTGLLEPGLSPDAANLIERMLSKDPAGRPQAAAVADTFTRLRERAGFNLS